MQGGSSIRSQNTLTMRLSSLLLMLLLLALPALANNVFVGNKPYEGEVYGTSSDVRFVLSELAEALSVEYEETESGWTLGGVSVPTLVDKDKVWVELDRLPEGLIRVVRNASLNTIDLYLMETVEDGPDGSWASGGTLVFFYADWSEACRAMEQTMAHIAQSRSLKVEFLNVDNPDSSVYKRYARRFEGDKIPFYLLLDTRGRKIDAFSGFLTYGELLDKLKESFSAAKNSK